jgi:hypothetical protein
MKIIGITGIVFFTVLIFQPFFIKAAEELGNDPSVLFVFKKKELNTGLVFYTKKEREGLRTDVSRQYDELMTGSARFRWANRNWNYIGYRQEEWDFWLETGPLAGNGNLIDSSATEVIEADYQVAGLRTNVAASYASRFYHDVRNYTIVKVNVWGRYDLFRKKADGTLLDSTGVTVPYDEKSDQSKFRGGFESVAGWGWGRLNPMNHYMTAEYFLDKYYKGRIFSEEEIKLVAYEIGKIKHRRDARDGHSPEQETEQINAFLNRKMLLEIPQNAQSDWELSEFQPRFHGSRIEAGPFFKYFNREPDFVWGGYVQYKNAKYIGFKWNRDVSANLSYNSYKKHDWLLLEAGVGWTFYPNLKTRYSFGVKYVPGVTVQSAENFGKIRNNFIPYLGYFSQVSSTCRVDVAFSWRIAASDQFMLPGPELSVSVYSSRY